MLAIPLEGKFHDCRVTVVLVVRICLHAIMSHCRCQARSDREESLEDSNLEEHLV